MDDVMIDIETLDTTQTSVILSIGAVYFDRDTGNTGGEFYCKINKQCTDNALRTISKATIDWWNLQDETIQEEAMSGTTPLVYALTDLSDFITPKSKVWSNGATFDTAILENAYTQLGTDIPWKFWNVRDVRTVVDLAYGFASKSEKPENAHDPIVDCKCQIDYICRMIKALRN